MKLLFNALSKYIIGVLFVGTLLFLPAGSFNYYNGWLFICLLFAPMFIIGVVLFIKSPKLLEKRLNAKEKENTQKNVVAFSGLLFIVGFIVAGLDYRFEWSELPLWAVIISSVILLVSYALYIEVMRENEYLSRTIEVQEGQKVVDTGLYGIIRHPMYSITILLFLSIPVVLGSWWSFICFLPYPVIIIIRIQNEEAILEADLNGYSEYKKRVKYKIFPLIW